MTTYKINDIQKLKDRIFVFDANILIGLYSYNPVASTKVAIEYISNFLIKNKSKLYIDNTVINEFINRYIKKELGLEKGETFDKKIHRNSDEYNNCLDNLKTKLDNIKQSYNVIKHIGTDIFHKLQELDNYKTIFNKMEFTDYSIKEVAKENNAILITADNDFYNCDIDILKI